MTKLVIALTLLIASSIPGSALVTVREFDSGEEIRLEGQDKGSALSALFNRPNRVFATETSGFDQTYTTACYKGSPQELKAFARKVAGLPYQEKFVDLNDEKVGIRYTDNCNTDKATIEYDWSISASLPFINPITSPKSRTYSVVLAIYDAPNSLKGYKLPSNLTVIERQLTPARETKKGISVYRLLDKAVTGVEMEKKDFYTVKLDAEPVIYPDEIILLDQTQRKIQVKPEALNRLPKPGVHGIPLIVCGDNKRMFVLGIWTLISSYAPSYPTTTWEMIDRNKNTITLDLIMPIKSDELEKPSAYQEFFDILRRDGKLVEQTQK